METNELAPVCVCRCINVFVVKLSWHVATGDARSCSIPDRSHSATMSESGNLAWSWPDAAS